MKQFTIIALTSFVIAIAWGGVAQAQDTKALQFTGTHYYGHTPKVFKLDQDQMIGSPQKSGHTEQPSCMRLQEVFHHGKKTHRQRIQN
jgi:hypothetical protein